MSLLELRYWFTPETRPIMYFRQERNSQGALDPPMYWCGVYWAPAGLTAPKNSWTEIAVSSLPRDVTP